MDVTSSSSSSLLHSSGTNSTLTLPSSSSTISIGTDNCGYIAPWVIYSMGWSTQILQPQTHRLAIGSFIEEYKNKIQIIDFRLDKNEMVKVLDLDHPYPATKLAYQPAKESADWNILATTGDYLRLWKIHQEEAALECTLNNNRNSDTCAPLTSMDWNPINPNIVGTSSIDTTCTIWDINATTQPTTQLIAHDAEVYDMAFGHSVNIFASVGADGSLRTFDLRSLESSTILYESPQLHPLLRIEWNQHDPNYIATIMSDSSTVVILDVRIPTLPIAELRSHCQSVNAIAWSPSSAYEIATVGEDRKACIWNLSALPKPIETPERSIQAEVEINNIAWSSLEPSYIGLAVNNTFEVVKAIDVL